MDLPCQEKKHVFKVIDFLKREEVNRGRDPLEVYNHGDCGNLYTHLKSVFNCAKPIMWRPCHVGTVIGGTVYDIENSGELTAKHRILPDDYVEEELSNNHGIKDFYTLFFDAIKRAECKEAEKKLMDETAERLREYLVEGEGFEPSKT